MLVHPSLPRFEERPLVVFPDSTNPHGQEGQYVETCKTSDRPVYRRSVLALHINLWLGDRSVGREGSLMAARFQFFGTRLQNSCSGTNQTGVETGKPVWICPRRIRTCLIREPLPLDGKQYHQNWTSFPPRRWILALSHTCGRSGMDNNPINSANP